LSIFSLKVQLVRGNKNGGKIRWGEVIRGGGYLLLQEVESLGCGLWGKKGEFQFGAASEEENRKRRGSG